jgi:hypothetical protein
MVDIIEIKNTEFNQIDIRVYEPDEKYNLNGVKIEGWNFSRANKVTAYRTLYHDSTKIRVHVNLIKGDRSICRLNNIKGSMVFNKVKRIVIREFEDFTQINLYM